MISLSCFNFYSSNIHISWQISGTPIRDNCPHQLECRTAYSYTESIQRLRLDVVYVVLVYTLYRVLWLHVVIWYHQELYCKRCVVWPTKSWETMHLLSWYSWRNTIRESMLKERILNEVLAHHSSTNVERPTPTLNLSSNYILTLSMCIARMLYICILIVVKSIINIKWATISRANVDRLL